MKRCSSGKEIFGTQKQAKEWIKHWNETKADGQLKKKLNSAYLCNECNCWHVSKREDNKLNGYIKEIREQRKMFVDIQNMCVENLKVLNKIIKLYE